MKPVSLLIVGAGSRGTGYGRYALSHPDEAKVVAVAEPREEHRRAMVEAHGIPAGNVFTDWREAADRERMADAVIIATRDAMHVAPAEAFAARGYAMLLEKPMAPDEAGCRRIVEAALANDILFAVCHVLRYTDYTRTLVSMIADGAVGDVVDIQRVEPVGYWHQAHSFVRGNWGNEARSSAMLLAKSCHDIDWLRYVMGVPCRRVSSFGSLFHFRPENKPAGAADRCLDCPVAPECPYSAQHIYLDRLAAGNAGWPTTILAREVTEESITEALRTGPYGRCVYACDNDVVDHQVVNMEFAGGRTASFAMIAFNAHGGRRTLVHGTRGEIRGDARVLRHLDFLTDTWTEIDTAAADASITGGHGGGDGRLMQSFLAAVATGDRSKILSGPAETLESHLIVFAAERARRNGTVEEIG